MKSGSTRWWVTVVLVSLGLFGVAFAVTGLLVGLPAPAAGGTCGPGRGSEAAIVAFFDPITIGAGTEPPSTDAAAHADWVASSRSARRRQTIGPAPPSPFSSSPSAWWSSAPCWPGVGGMRTKNRPRTPPPPGHLHPGRVTPSTILRRSRFWDEGPVGQGIADGLVAMPVGHLVCVSTPSRAARRRSATGFSISHW